MKASKIQVPDITELGANGTLTVELLDYRACISAKNTVGYVKKMYPRKDGYEYFCRINGNVITIGTARPETLKRTMTAKEIKEANS